MKKTGLLIILIAITCCIILVPPIISGQNAGNITNKITYRNYHASNRPKLTGNQVARMYYNREISLVYNSLPIIAENDEQIQKDIIDVIKLLFGNDEETNEMIEKMLLNSIINYSRNSVLIKVDNQPTALNFVSCAVENDNGCFEILYEEKTRTIIRFSYDGFENIFENIKDIDLYIEKICLMIINYYENQINFNKDEYYLLIETPTTTKTDEDKYMSNFFINCGLMQYSDIILSEEQDVYLKNIYN